MSKEDQSVQWIFLEPIDIHRRCHMFNHPTYHVHHEQKFVPRRIEFVKVTEGKLDEVGDLKIGRSGRMFPDQLSTTKFSRRPQRRQSLKLFSRRMKL
jgi:hypothetical protein